MAKRAVIPLDRSQRAELALQAIPKLLDPEDELVLLSIAEPKSQVQRGTRPGRNALLTSGPQGEAIGGRSPDFITYAETEDQVIQGQLDELDDYLHSKAAELRKLGFVNTRLLCEISDDAAGTIADLARRVEPTFIVMVRTTHPDIGTRVFGTVAQRLIREDIAPVVILPAK
ncbi:MAG TPA: universal stress protein [Dehalococcoidia bacterium]|nr:universal stress protein [Dehalococcoidia bacterium]